jgi:hypothetical protein
MDTILIILGAIGFFAIAISAYVFTVAARSYVSDEPEPLRNPAVGREAFRERRRGERRSGRTVSFPLEVNGELIEEDRRHRPDRRAKIA